MHDNSDLVRTRIERFITERIQPARYRARQCLKVEAWEVPDEPMPFAHAVDQDYQPFTVGQPWSKPWGTTWFHVTGSIPPEWRQVEGTRAELYLDLGFSGSDPGFQAEGLVYSADGTIIKAIEPFNTYVVLGADDEIDLYIEAASNPDITADGLIRPTAMGDKKTAGTKPIYSLRCVDAVLLDLEVWQLEREVFALRGLMESLPAETIRAAEILRALEHAVDAVDPEDVAHTAVQARAAIAGVLAKPAAASAHRISAIGHAHIDSAWLWPVRETIRKCARTFSNVLELMDTHPEFKFACSSAQQFAWMKEFYPALFERIRVRVEEGRFIPVGGMWVESDTNMPSGESMARQLVSGKSFFLREFGRETREVWLPDSFGYSAALPQIVAASGSQYFLSQKLSWNETDVFPHSTFEWEGIDGTRVLTHFPPVATYNSDLSAGELARAERNYLEKGEANSSLVPFGYGDGGGGPTREMLATAALTRSLEGSPTVHIESPEAFFERAEAEYASPPVWTGELYLEFHRGTYTSQARTKRGNRRSESLLREAELWAATASIRQGVAYPHAELEEAWRTVLLQQFHDILPGSSISWVHRVAEENYARVAGELESLIAASVESLGDTGSASTETFFNASSFVVDGIAPLSAGTVQRSGSISVEELDAGFVLTSDRAKFVLDASGRVTSALDLASGREAVVPGEYGAELQLFRDTPNQWDAWDIDRHYRRHERVLDSVDSMAIVSADDHRVVVRVERSFASSKICQEFALDAGSASLEITTKVDWHERQKLLKLAFPIDVHADKAVSEIQYGHISRPIAENTSWDFARFETCAHRWVHVGESGFGVAVANDATYGHDITRRPRVGGGSTTLVRQSLLRAPVFPDPEADQGEHVFHSSFVVGAGIQDAVREGYRLNLPLRPSPSASIGSVSPLVSVDNMAVVVEAVKLADDHSGDLIVRLYESLGGRAHAAVTINMASHDSDGDRAVLVRETDLLERELGASAALAGVDGCVATLALRPFQIVTLRVSRS